MMEDNNKLDRETGKLQTEKKELQDRLTAAKEVEDGLRKQVDAANDALASQKRHLEGISEEQVNGLGKQLILERVKIDELQQRLREKDSATRSMEEEHAANISELMNEIETERRETEKIGAMMNEDAQSKTQLERQLQRLKKNLTQVRWKAALSSVHFNVKAARMDVVMAHLGAYRQAWIDSQRDFEEHLTEQGEGPECLYVSLSNNLTIDQISNDWC